MKLFKVKNTKGTALIFAYCTISVLLILVGSIAFRASAELNMSRRHIAQTEALYLSEGAAESVVYNLAYAIANHQTEPLSSTPISISGLVFPPSSSYSPDGFDINYTCEPIDYDQTFTDATGITTIVRNYRIVAISENAFFTTSNDPMKVSVNQIIARKKTYTFQHAVFYADDLEILPGPDMTLSGKIHSNSDIYLGSHNSLTVDSDYLFSAGSIYNKRKNDGSLMGGDVIIKLKDEPNYAMMLQAGDPSALDCLRSDWVDESQNRWKGTVKSSVHGVTALAVPEVGSIQPDGYYAGEANVKIVNGVLSDGGTLMIEGVDIPPGTITVTENSFYNTREGEWVKMTEVNMKKLAGYAEGDLPGNPSYPNHLPDNGLLYATANDAPANKQNGVRLKQGAEIESASGLTVVSNLPVYIQGDYNSVDKKPASVICDAVNILSNNWSDAVGYTDAANTQINAAFIGGVDTTTPGHYNGGLENYPRLHENWSASPKKVLSIRGSFVELWNSQIAQGEWHYGSPYYKAPVRDWDYDLDFNDEANLPPFTPFAIEMARVAWWRS